MQYFGFDRPSFAFKTFGFGSSEFSPLDLFAGGKQGVWYDPSDKSTLFQDIAGTVPVTKDGDPVGLILDKSQGLEKVSYTFKKTAAGEWVDNGNGSYTSNGTKDAGGYLAFTIDNYGSGNKTFEISYKVTRSDSGGIKLFRPTDGGYTNAVGEYKRIFYANSAEFRFLSASFVGDISDITIKEIKGNHAIQSVSAARPIYKKDVDKAWLYNDKIDDKLLVELPAMTATVVKATDEGVSIDYPVSITAGDYPITPTSALGRDYGYLIINKELSASETTQVTNYFNVKRGV